jgi:hypothetical protein
MGKKKIPQSGPPVVFLGQETTGFDYPIRPVQVAAIDSWGKLSFSLFVNPGREISRQATEVNGFSYDVDRSAFIYYCFVFFLLQYVGYTIARFD